MSLKSCLACELCGLGQICENMRVITRDAREAYEKVGWQFLRTTAEKDLLMCNPEIHKITVDEQ